MPPINDDQQKGKEEEEEEEEEEIWRLLEAIRRENEMLRQLAKSFKELEEKLDRSESKDKKEDSP